MTYIFKEKVRFIAIDMYFILRNKTNMRLTFPDSFEIKKYIYLKTFYIINQ